MKYIQQIKNNILSIVIIMILTGITFRVYLIKPTLFLLNPVTSEAPNEIILGSSMNRKENDLRQSDGTTIDFTDQNLIHFFNLQTQQKYITQLDSQFVSKIKPGTDFCYHTRFRILCIDILGQQVLWENKIHNGEISNALIIDQFIYLLVANKLQTKLIKIDKADGIIKWQKVLDLSDNDKLDLASINSTQIMIYGSSPQVTLINAESGEKIWDNYFNQLGVNSFISINGQLVFLMTNGTFQIYDEATKALKKVIYETADVKKFITSNDQNNQIIGISHQKKLVIFDFSNLEKIEFKASQYEITDQASLKCLPEQINCVYLCKTNSLCRLQLGQKKLLESQTDLSFTVVALNRQNDELYLLSDQQKLEIFSLKLIE